MLSGFINQEVVFESNVQLSGTLTLPTLNETEKFPAILLLPGTGKIDRDGNASRGNMKLHIYRQLAEYLASIGFVTLRYDKRGVGKSIGKMHETSMTDLVDDASSALQFLRKNAHVLHTKIFVLGHSEGAILATALSEREKVAGLILLSGAGCRLDEAIKFQQQLAFSELESVRGLKGWLIKKLKLVEKSRKKNEAFFQNILEEKSDVIRMGFARVSSKWLKEHFTYDLKRAYEQIDCPVLAITGEKDVQVDPNRLQQLSDIKAPVAAYVIENMNHILKEQTSEASVLQAKKQYKKASVKELHQELKEILREWLTEQVSKSNERSSMS